MVYKQLALALQIAKQQILLSNNKNYWLRKEAFSFCNKHKTAVKPRIRQISAVSIAVYIGKVLKSIIINIDFQSWKLLYSSQKKVTWSNY